MCEPISRDELYDRLNRADPPVLVEALGADYYADANLPGAINIPPGPVDRLAAGQVPDVDTELVVYGTDGGVSARIVARRLDDLGYSQVRLYEGGKEDWVEHGLPVHRDSDDD